MDDGLSKALQGRASRKTEYEIAQMAIAGAAAIARACAGTDTSSEATGSAAQSDGGAESHRSATQMSRKKKKRLKSEARRLAKERSISQKHISSHKMVTIQDLSPAYSEASTFMRKRMKKQQRRMEAQSQTTMNMFKSRREAGQAFRSAADVGHEAMKLFGASDPKGQRRESKRLRGQFLRIKLCCM